MEGITTTIKVEDSGTVTLLHGGPVSSHMFFENGVRHLCHYNTPYGDMVVGVSSKTIKNELTSTGGRLNVVYALEINGMATSENSFDITVKASNETLIN